MLNTEQNVKGLPPVEQKQNSGTIAGHKINLREIEECIFIK